MDDYIYMLYIYKYICYIYKPIPHSQALSQPQVEPNECIQFHVQKKLKLKGRTIGEK